MIIKHADDRSGDVATLEALLDHPDASATDRQRITAEIRRIKAGVRGEAAAAYEIDRLFAADRRYAVLHDLRIEVDGQTAQIDHLIFNRFMDAFLCETKNFAEGLSCNEHGEWVGFRNNRPFGVASPLKQGARHQAILQALLKKKPDLRPRRLGMPIAVQMHYFVLVSNSARISRPKAGSVPDIDRVVKIEGFGERRKQHAETTGVVGSLLKIVSVEAMTAFVERLASCHVPATPDWHGKFGLVPLDAPTDLAAAKVHVAPHGVRREPVMSESAKTRTTPTKSIREKKKLICTACGTSVEFVVARFCWRNEARFGGQAYCRDCQASV